MQEDLRGAPARQRAGTLPTSNAKLSPLVMTDPERCVNCHACVGACPVNANDASGNIVTVIHDECIGCGACVDACSHGARRQVDDLPVFLDAAGRGEPLIAIVAPAVAATFPDTWRNLNGWLLAHGVDAVYDVSFGAELTVKTYLDHIQSEKPQTVIAQPCPAIVTYIEVHQPELLPHLSPADSPVLHLIKMIRAYTPEYANHRVVFISPCVAKKREFEATGCGALNVTFNALLAHFQKNEVRLESYPQSDFSNPPAERAAAFSTPGGLLETAKRWDPSISGRARKVEGPHLVYDYLRGLPAAIAAGDAPLLVDCLSCEKGCNGGTGTPHRKTSIDALEARVARRVDELKAHYREAATSEEDANRAVEALVEEYWQPDLYRRSYVNRSHVRPSPPQRERIKALLPELGGDGEEVIDCGACGYGSCEGMAGAIALGRNRSDNCHHSLMRQLSERQMKDEQVAAVNRATSSLKESTEFLAASVVEMTASMQEVSRSAETALDVAGKTAQLAADSGNVVSELETSGRDIGKIVEVIQNTADRLKLLSLNAMIEASHAGAAGSGFAVVAGEVKNLAGETAEGSANIESQIRTTQDNVDLAGSALRDMNALIVQIKELQEHITTAVAEQADVSSQVEQRLHGLSKAVSDISDSMAHLADC